MTYQTIDTSDVDRWMGREVGGEQLRQPVTQTDVFRWVQAMRNPNPAYFDQDWVSGRGQAFRVPSSMILACSIRHGVHTSIQGEIVGGRQMNGGDEWWFEGPVRVGDLVTSKRRALDYKLTETGFAGPTLFQRGETAYFDQDGRLLARQYSTSIRFLAANLKGRDGGGGGAEAHPPELSAEQLAAFEQQRLDYARSLHEPAPIARDALTPGAKLPVRPIGPHSVQSFTCEQRAFLYAIWGNLSDDGLPRTARNIRSADAALDPEFADGLFHGASAGHTDSRAAAQRGMPRAYGAGASACAWLIDYVSNWVGEEGAITRCKVQYRNPILVGDLTFVSGEVTGASLEADGAMLVELSLKTENQDGKPGAVGTATARLGPGAGQ